MDPVIYFLSYGMAKPQNHSPAILPEKVHRDIYIHIYIYDICVGIASKWGRSPSPVGWFSRKHQFTGKVIETVERLRILIHSPNGSKHLEVYLVRAGFWGSNTWDKIWLISSEMNYPNYTNYPNYPMIFLGSSELFPSIGEQRKTGAGSRPGFPASDSRASGWGKPNKNWLMFLGWTVCCPSSLAKLVNITPISLGFMVNIYLYYPILIMGHHLE